MQAAEISSAQTSVCVSVVIPTRNRPELLRKAVASALRQDFENLELIVVADGEGPRTREVLDSFCDSRLRVIDLAVSVGGGEARNIGVRAARGEWIAFLDDDDEWLTKKLSRQIVAARKSNARWRIVSSRMIVRTPEQELVRPLRSYKPEKPLSEFLFCRESLDDGPFAMQTSTLMTQKELMLAVPFRSGLERHQDWDWLLRAARVPGAEFAVVDEPLVIYRTEDGRESVGRSQDWKFSMSWGAEMKGYFSPKAYSWFIATECASRAVKRRAGFRVYAEIARRFTLDGMPSWRSAGMLAFFLAFPPPFRKSLHRLVRRRRRPTPAVLVYAGRTDLQARIGMEL